MSADRDLMTFRCRGGNCGTAHAAPNGDWTHEIKLEEDAGIVHTDDCGFFGCEHDHDPDECCNSGQPGVKCRVRTAAAQEQSA